MFLWETNQNKRKDNIKITKKKIIEINKINSREVFTLKKETHTPPPPHYVTLPQNKLKNGDYKATQLGPWSPPPCPASAMVRGLANLYL